MTLSLDTAYRSFGGEVEASSTPTICRLPDSRRHQLSAIALTMAIQDYGRTIHRSGTLLTLVVPFTGDAGMFWVRPNTFDSAPPRGNLNGNTMVLRVRGTDLNKEAVSKAFNSTLDDFARYLAWQRASADQFNPEI